MSKATLVLYVSKDRGAGVQFFDDKGMLREEQTAGSVKHVRVEAHSCSLSISFAEFETAIVVKVSGNVSVERKNGVLEVRCLGS